jgi:hypothetical protein
LRAIHRPAVIEPSVQIFRCRVQEENTLLLVTRP